MELFGMSTITERFPVDQLYIWAALMVLVGLSISVSSIASLLAGSGVITDWLMLVGGGVILFGTGWEVRQRNPTEFSKSGYWFVLLGVAALLSIGSSVMIVVGLL